MLADIFFSLIFVFSLTFWTDSVYSKGTERLHGESERAAATHQKGWKNIFYEIVKTFQFKNE